MLSRRSPRIGQAGRRHPVRISLPWATGRPIASAGGKTIRSRPRRDLAAAGGQAFPDYPASIQGEGVGGWAYVDQDCCDVWKVPPAGSGARCERTMKSFMLLLRSRIRMGSMGAHIKSSYGAVQPPRLYRRPAYPELSQPLVGVGVVAWPAPEMGDNRRSCPPLVRLGHPLPRPNQGVAAAKRAWSSCPD